MNPAPPPNLSQPITTTSHHHPTTFTAITHLRLHRLNCRLLRRLITTTTQKLNQKIHQQIQRIPSRR
ncbi:hypothetical protein Hanom_Chr06g00492671 [Helianthus anomalus]